MNGEENKKLSISQASDKTGLPESTIRYYDQEFGGFLNIARGDNNQRLFTEKNLEDLEYIRYLIKREELSVDEVYQRLEREEKFDDRKKLAENDDSKPGQEQPSAPDTIPSQRLEKLLEKFDRRLDNLESRQEEIHRLLDMNLQRYNKLVENL